MRWLLGLAKGQPQCFVALLLQIVPPQSLGPEDVSMGGTATREAGATAGGETRRQKAAAAAAAAAVTSHGGRARRRRGAMDVDGDDDDGDDGDDGLARSAMTVVAVGDRTRSSSSSSSSHSGGSGGSRRGSSSTATTSPSPANGPRKRRRGGAKQMLADILEESSSDAAEEEEEPPQRMDVDRDHTDDDDGRRGGAAGAALAATAEDFSWQQFHVSSLRFDVAHGGPVRTGATIPLFLPPVVVDTQRYGGGASAASVASSAAPLAHRVSAVQGHVSVASSAAKASISGSSSGATTTQFDTSHLLGLHRLWMQLWQWCDLLPVPRSTWSPATDDRTPPELHADQQLLLEITRDSTRLLNAIVGVLRHHPQCRLLLRDGSSSSIVTSFFFRDTLHRMHPLLRLSRKDYDQLEALEE